MILYSTHKSDKLEFGKGIYINRHIMDNVIDFQRIKESNFKIRVEHKYLNFTMTLTRAPMKKTMK
jgi:hypothetical protein